MRPPTPKEGMVPEPPRRRAHTFSGRMEAQFDPETGEELTPAYSVPTSPSIVFTPPGVEVTGPLPPDFCAQYSRMAPLAERAHRHHVYGAKSVILANSSDSGIKTVTSVSWGEIDPLFLCSCYFWCCLGFGPISVVSPP